VAPPAPAAERQRRCDEQETTVTITPSVTPRPWPTRLARALAVVFLVLLWGAGVPAGDSARYREWAQVAASGDIFMLSGHTASPFGVPVSQWSHGTGFVLAALAGLVPLDRSIQLVSWLAAIVFWGALWKLLIHTARGHAPTALFGLGVAFVGTHAGFYSFTYGAESLSLAFVAVIAWVVIVPREWRAAHAVALGAAAGLLLVTRTQLGIYAAAGLGVFACRVLGERVPGSARPWGLLALAAAPVVVAGAQVLLVDRWMTGSLLGSPYVWAEGDFRSIDLARPQLGAVLLHPWHGLLVYHPVYALGLLALACGFRGATPGGRRLGAAVALVLAGQVYLQASWYVWWMGTGTFGMRGLVTAAPILVPALVHQLARRREAGGANTVWVVAATAASLWSYLLLGQGETNFVTWAELVAGQGAQLLRELSGTHLVPLLVLISALWWVPPRRRAGPGTDVALLRGAALLCTLGFLALTRMALDRPMGRWLAAPVPVVVEALFALLVPLAVSAAGRAATAGPGHPWLFERATALGMALVFLTGSATFARLAVRTETLAGERPTGRSFRYVGSVDHVELLLSYAEYLRVPGFDAEKERLRAFLERAGVPTRPPPGPRRRQGGNSARPSGGSTSTRAPRRRRSARRASVRSSSRNTAQRIRCSARRRRSRATTRSRSGGARRSTRSGWTRSASTASFRSLEVERGTQAPPPVVGCRCTVCARSAMWSPSGSRSAKAPGSRAIRW
jgi:hypothetical protein